MKKTNLNGQQPLAAEPKSDWQSSVDALSPSMVTILSMWRGYSPGLIEELKRANLIGWLHNKIAFPIADEASGTIVGCHYRSMSHSGTWAAHWFSGVEGVLPPLVINDPRSQKDVYIFESQWDLLALLNAINWKRDEPCEVGFIATRGAMKWACVKDYCNPNTTVFAFAQNDAPGQQWMQEIAQMVPCKVLNVKTPEKFKDLNEWIQKGATGTEIVGAIEFAQEVKKSVKTELLVQPPDKLVESISMGSATSNTISHHTTLATVIADIQGGKWATDIATFRAASGGEADRLKKNLPGILWAGTFTHRRNDCLEKFSGYFCADIDKVPDRLAELREIAQNDPHVAAAFVSPSGTGYKIVFRVPVATDAKQYQQIFSAVCAHVAEKYGVKVDGSTKDIARLCFVSHDPDTFYKQDAQPIPVTSEKQKTTAVLANTKAPGKAKNDEIYPGITLLTTTKDGRFLIQLPTDDRLLSEFVGDIGRALSESDVFNRNGLPFTIDLHNKGLKLISPEAFRTLAENWVVCYKIDETEDGGLLQVRRSMGVTDAGAVLASMTFLELLRPIRRVNLVRLPAWRQSGVIELLPNGYDLESRTYTFEAPEMVCRESMTFDEAKAVLTTLFEEFCFPQDNGRSLGVSLAGMMTLFAYGLLPKGAIIPCIIIKANAEGAGKTGLVKVIVMPVFGCFVAGVKPTNDDEVRKYLSSAVLEGRSYIVYDNVKNHLDSPALEAFLTSSVWSDRILGASKNFTSEKDTVVFITGNDCTVSEDLRRRSLVVELFMPDERAEERKFKRELDMYLKEQRTEIFSALWTIVQEWDKNGRPQSSRVNSSFPEWARIIGGIIEFAGFCSPLTPPSASSGIDRNGADMRKLANGLPPDTQCKSLTFAELIKLAEEVGAFEDLLSTASTSPELLDRRAKTIISRLLRRYIGRKIGGYIFSSTGHGHSRSYEFKKPGVGQIMPKELET